MHRQSSIFIDSPTDFDGLAARLARHHSHATLGSGSKISLRPTLNVKRPVSIASMTSCARGEAIALSKGHSRRRSDTLSRTRLRAYWLGYSRSLCSGVMSTHGTTTKVSTSARQTAQYLCRFSPHMGLGVLVLESRPRCLDKDLLRRRQSQGGPEASGPLVHIPRWCVLSPQGDYCSAEDVRSPLGDITEY